MAVIIKNLIILKKTILVILYLIPTLQSQINDAEIIFAPLAEQESDENNSGELEAIYNIHSIYKATEMYDPDMKIDSSSAQTDDISDYMENYTAFWDNTEYVNNFKSKEHSSALFDSFYNSNTSLHDSHVHFNLTSDSEDEDPTFLTSSDTDSKDRAQANWIPQCKEKDNDTIFSLEHISKTSRYFYAEDNSCFTLFKDSPVVRSVITKCLDNMTDNAYSKLFKECADAVYMIISFNLYHQMLDTISFIDYTNKNSLVEEMTELIVNKKEFRFETLLLDIFCEEEILDGALEFIEYYKISGSVIKNDREIK